MKTLLIVVFSLMVALASADNVPVFYCAPGTNNQPAVTVGNTMSSSDFKMFVKKLTSEHKGSVNVITLDRLNSEDVLFAKSEFKSGLSYLPLVNDPYTTLNDYLFSAGIEASVFPAGASLDSGLDEMAKLCRSSDSLVFFTGERSNSDSAKRRTRRDANDESSNSNTVIYGDGECAATFGLVYFLNQTAGISSDYSDLDADSAGSTFACNFDNGTAVLTLKFNTSSSSSSGGEYLTQLKLTFTENQRNWLVTSSSVMSNVDTYTATYMGNLYNFATPLTFSFACTRVNFQLQSSAHTNQRLTLFIDEVQFQPFEVEIDNSTSTTKKFTFGNPNYCQSFFTNGIWMAIMTLVLMFVILSLGVCCLLQVKTMDRFDDPKGKPLVIAAEK